MPLRPVSLFRTVAIVALLLAATACTAILGLDEKPEAADAGKPLTDGGKADAAANAPCTPDDAGYHNVSTRSCWDTFTVTAAFDQNSDYAGGSYDGRYLYFISNVNGLVVRYDSHAAFASQSSWSEYDTTELQGDGLDGGYAGVVFDGRYMYFVPQGYAPVFLQYDTKGDFDTAASWKTFSFNATVAISYFGGTFDGRYIYFAPYDDFNQNNSGLVERFDTTLDFAAKASWSAFDTTTVPGPLKGGAAAFDGAVFDGRYAYFVPSGLEANVVAAYDTTADFTSTSSWQLFDTGDVNSQVEGFDTGIFDGKYLYLVPDYASEVVLQHDVSLSFTDKTAWSEYNASPGAGMIGSGLTPTFSVGAFDGRYLYFVPGLLGEDEVNGVLARHDDLDAFTDAGSWTLFDTTKIKASSFGAAVFDGQYLYLAPAGTTVFARFNAKETPAQPALPHYFGSFY